MTIDEAIEHAREKAEELKNEAINCQKDSCRRCETDCIECAEEHKQLAEWLEELKELRKCVKSSAFVDGYEKGRADAIDELENILKDFFKKQNNPKSKFRPSIVMMEEDALNILEQLKEQKNG